MNKAHVCVFLLCLFGSCQQKEKKVQDRCAVLQPIIQKALTAPILDTLFLPDYKDSTLKIVKKYSYPICSLRWNAKYIVYLDSADVSAIIDPGTFERRIIDGRSQMVGIRIPSFVLRYKAAFVDEERLKLYFQFKNNGIFVDFDFRKKEDNWEITKYHWGEF